MRFDAQNQLSVAQAFTGAATVSTNSYQKQSAAQDISIGRMMSLLFIPTVAAGAGSTALFEVIQADDAALTSNVTSLASITVPAASLAQGYGQEVIIPKGSMTQLYVGARVTLTGGTTTITLDCYLMPTEDIQKFKSFPKVVDALV